jgi:hypothetical protein
VLTHPTLTCSKMRLPGKKYMNESVSQRMASSCRAVTRATASCKFAHYIVCALFLLCGFSLVPGCGSGGSAGSGGSGGSGSGETNPPTITSLSPSSAAAGGGAFTLTVNGTNFTSSGTTVAWNGTALATTYVNASEVTAPVTTAMIATGGTATVVVTTAGGTSSGAAFTINLPPSPTVTAAHGAISSDGSTISINGYLTDGSLNVETLPAYIDWETWLPTAAYGQKLSQDGSILYQPLTNGIDMIERNTGRLLYRVQVPGTVANVFDSIFLGASNGTLGYITSSGITFVDLSSLAIPAAASTPFPATRSAERTGTRTEGRTGLKPLPQAGTRRPKLAISGDGKRAWY